MNQQSVASRKVTLVLPVSCAEGGEVRLAERPAKLEGKVVGILENRKKGSQPLLEGIAAQLKSKFGAREVIFRRKESMSAWAEEALFDELAATCAAVLVGVGD